MPVVERTSLWRHRDFVVWWLGQSVSLLGSAFTQIAMPITAAVYLRATPAQMGLLFAVQFAPQLLLALPAGVWLDRHRRRPVLVAGQLLSAISLAAVPVLAVAGHLRIEHLYAVSFLAGAGQTVAPIAQNSYMPTLVGRDNLIEANSKLQYSRTLASLFGPGIAGFAVQLLTGPVAIAFDAASFVVGAATAAILRVKEAQPEGSRRHPIREAADGLGWLWRQPVVGAITLTILVANFAGNVTSAIFVLLFVGRIGVTPVQFGIVIAAASLSSLIGARLAQPLVQRGHLGRLMVAGAILLPIGQALSIPAAFSRPLVAFALLLVGASVSGFGLMVYNINQQALRQAVTPDHLLGRVQSGVFVLVALFQVIGALLGGALGQTVGLVATLIIGTALNLFAALPTIFSPLRSLRAVPAAAEA